MYTKGQEAENRAQQLYGEKYNPLLMFDSKKAVSRMLNEDMERQAQKEQQTKAQRAGTVIPALCYSSCNLLLIICG